MKLTPVIAALRARCPYFENRVAGAAQFKNLPEVGKLRLPAAYVVPGDDSPGENKSQTDYWQELKEGFWGDTVVECVLNKLCPSHTYVIFKYPE